MKCKSCGQMIDDETSEVPTKKPVMKAAQMMKPFAKMKAKKKVVAKITHKGDPFFGKA